MNPSIFNFNQHRVKPRKVHDDRYGKVNTYPAQAWKGVYRVDLSTLFGAV